METEGALVGEEEDEVYGLDLAWAVAEAVFATGVGKEAMEAREQ